MYRFTFNGESIVAEVGPDGRPDHRDLGPVELETFRALGWTVEELPADEAEAISAHLTKLRSSEAWTVDPLDYIVTVPRTGARANLSSIARHYIARAASTPSYVQLRCECGEGDVVVDRLASETDVAELVSLLEHSLFDHISPRRIEATRVEAALDLLSIPATEDGSVMIGVSA